MIRLTAASLVDVPQIMMMERATDTREFIIPYTQSEHRRGILDPDLVYLRVHQDAEFVGFIILGLDPDGISVEFRRIVVSAKGRGIGEAAIKAMETFCQSELTRSRIWLDVFDYNHRGQHIYEKLGYKRFGGSSQDGKRLFLYDKRL